MQVCSRSSSCSAKLLETKGLPSAEERIEFDQSVGIGERRRNSVNCASTCASWLATAQQCVFERELVMP
jgi:hypothetical protein